MLKAKKKKKKKNIFNKKRTSRLGLDLENATITGYPSKRKSFLETYCNTLSASFSKKKIYIYILYYIILYYIILYYIILYYIILYYIILYYIILYYIILYYIIL